MTLTKFLEAAMTLGSVNVVSDISLQGPQLSLWTAKWIGTLRAVASLTAASQSPCQSMPWPGSISFFLPCACAAPAAAHTIISAMAVRFMDCTPSETRNSCRMVTVLTMMRRNLIPSLLYIVLLGGCQTQEADADPKAKAIREAYEEQLRRDRQEVVPTPRPSFLIVLPDQLRAQALGCMGNPDIRPPSLDAIARECCLCRHCCANTPGCCPARAGLLTGRYAHANGMVANDLR